MGGVGLVIFVQAHTGSFGIAGAVAGGFTLGLALAGPFVGRLVDRRGPRPVLIPAALISTTALLMIVVLGEAGAGAPALVAASVVTGASTPPISGVLRGSWPALITADQMTTAYIFDSILIDTVFVTGPLLTAILAATLGPSEALVAAAALGLLGTIWFVTEPAIRNLALTRAEHHTRAGAMASPTIRLLAFTGVPVGASFGALDVALPAFGASHGSSALGGVFTAAVAAGSVVSAFVYSARPMILGDLRQACVRLAIAQPLLSVPLLLAPAVGPQIVLAMIAGSYAAPTFTVRSRAAQISMPPGTGTEAFTWLLLAVMVGFSGGAALAGPLVEAGGWRAGIAVAIGVPTLWIPFIVAGRGLIPREG